MARRTKILGLLVTILGSFLLNIFECLEEDIVRLLEFTDRMKESGCTKNLVDETI